MTKKLNITAIANELEESAFFPSKKRQVISPIAPAQAPNLTQADVLPKQPERTTPERPNASTSRRPEGKRIITRNSFEIYEDQMDSLRKLSFKEKMEGKLGSMSAMVREAIDTYLQKKNLS